MRYSADRTSMLVRTAALLALAVVCGLLDRALLPATPLAGARLGIANVAVVVALVTLGPGLALQVSVGRVAVVGLLTGSIAGPGWIVSLTAASVAWAVMAPMSRAPRLFSLVGVSVAGASVHTLTQLAGAALLTGTTAPLVIAPLSLVVGLASGVAVGWLSSLIVSRLRSVDRETMRGLVPSGTETGR
jgi:heptaprenyl diphosphate synthase